MEINKKDLKIDMDCSKLEIVIVVPYFNEEIGLELLKNTKQELITHGVTNIKTIRTPGALEIPLTCKRIIKKEKPDALITLGAVIRGETSHYDMVCSNTFSGIMEVQLKYDTPIIFGILTCENVKQAKIRAKAKGHNKGKQVAQAALFQIQSN